jgi:hypothetical protein
MNWPELTAIREIGSWSAAVAFVAAVGARYLRSRLSERRKMIESAPLDQRSKLVESVLRDFRVIESGGLTRDQRFELIARLIDQRLALLRTAAVTLAGLSGIAATAVVASHYVRGPAELVVRLAAPVGDATTVSRLAGRLRIAAGSYSSDAVVSHGEARFRDVPLRIVGEAASLEAEVSGFGVTRWSDVPIPKSRVLELQLAPPATKLCGVVEPQEGAEPLADVAIEVLGQRAVPDESGRFCMTVPGAEGTVADVLVFTGTRLVQRTRETISSGHTIAITTVAGGADE